MIISHTILIRLYHLLKNANGIDKHPIYKDTLIDKVMAAINTTTESNIVLFLRDVADANNLLEQFDAIIANECWSLDGITFNFISLRDLLQNVDVKPGTLVYKGQRQYTKPSEIVSVEDVIETIDTNALDIVGNFTEDMPEVDDDAKEELSKFLQKWVEKHYNLEAWLVVDVQKYTVTQKDLDNL